VLVLTKLTEVVMSEVRVIEEKVVMWPETSVIGLCKVSGEAHDFVGEMR